jgi:hypothetical protein
MHALAVAFNLTEFDVLIEHVGKMFDIRLFDWYGYSIHTVMISKIFDNLKFI